MYVRTGRSRVPTESDPTSGLQTLVNRVYPKRLDSRRETGVGVVRWRDSGFSSSKRVVRGEEGSKARVAVPFSLE